jgi:hypothetical protein
MPSEAATVVTWKLFDDTDKHLKVVQQVTWMRWLAAVRRQKLAAFRWSTSTTEINL